LQVGRAGRFGTKGLAITMVASEDEVKELEKVQARFEIKVQPLPEVIDVKSYSIFNPFSERIIIDLLYITYNQFFIKERNNNKGNIYPQHN